MYCLDALKRFDRIDDDQVRAIAFEIALLGRAGLDQASADKKYTLHSIAGERFTGQASTSLACSPGPSSVGNKGSSRSVTAATHWRQRPASGRGKGEPQGSVACRVTSTRSQGRSVSW